MSTNTILLSNDLMTDETKRPTPAASAASAHVAKPAPFNNIAPCPGRKRINGGKWWIPNGMTSAQATYCESCMVNGHFDASQTTLWQPHGSLSNGVNCDCPCVLIQNALSRNGINVSVQSSDGTSFSRLQENHPAFPKYAATVSNSESRNLMHVIVPTSSTYHIELSVTQDKTPLTWYSIVSAKVGDKKVTINNDRLIYYPSSQRIEGFTTGTNDSFFFISPSKQETDAGVKYDGVNVSNIIEVKIQRYHRIPRREVYIATAASGDLFSFRGGATRGGGHTSNGGEQVLSMFDSAPAASRSKMVASTYVPESTLSGGTTISGGNFVRDVDVNTTNDTFEKVGDVIEFYVQLVCDQSEDDKYKANIAHTLKIRTQKKQEILDRISASRHQCTHSTSVIEVHQKNMAKYQEDIKQATDELKAYSDIPMPADHFIKF